MKSKNLTLCGLFTAFLMIFCVTACSDDKEEDVTVVFPEMQTIMGKASDSDFLDLSFNADADWTLTSNALWCYFVSQQAANRADASVSKQRTLSGKAGKQTVQIGISDEGQNSEKEDVATITIKMNGQEQVLAEVTRSTKERGLKLYRNIKADDGSESWEEIGEDDAIVAGYDKFITYKVTADFDFVASSLPEWLQVEGNAIIGKANEEVVFGIQAKEDDPKYYKDANNGEIVFSDEKTQAAVSTYKVIYHGMDADAIVIERNDLPEWNWEVSMDGKTFTNAGGMGSDSETITKTSPLKGWTIIARGDEYEIVFLEKTEQDGKPVFKSSLDADGDKVNWIKATKLENNGIEITVDPADKEREGYVLVFPKAVYDEIAKAPLDSLIKYNKDDEIDDLNYAYQQENILFAFTQKEPTQPGEVRIIKLAGADFNKPVTLGGKKEIEAAIEGFTEYLTSEYGVEEDKLFSVNAEDCQSVRIYVPFEIKAPEWQEGAEYDIKQIDAVSHNLSQGENTTQNIPEGAETGIQIKCPESDDSWDKDYTKAVDFAGATDITDPIVIVIKEDMGENGLVPKYVIVVLPSQE